MTMLTVKKISERLDVSQSTVLRWVNLGWLKAALGAASRAGVIASVIVRSELGL